MHRTALPFGDRRCVLHVVRCTHVAARHVGCCKSHPCTALHCTALHGRARRSALCSCCSGSCCLERAGCSLTGACAPWQHTAVHLYRPACAAVLGVSRIVSAHGPSALEPNPSDKQTNNQPNPRASRGRTLSDVLKRPRSICTTRRANTRLCTHGTQAWHAGMTRCARMRIYSCTTRVSTRSQRHARTWSMRQHRSPHLRAGRAGRQSERRATTGRFVFLPVPKASTPVVRR